MKLTALLLTVVCLQAGATGYSQTVSLKAKGLPLNAVFASIEKQTGLSFFFNYALIKNTKPVTLDVQDISIDDALNLILKGEGLDFYRTGKTIFIVKGQATSSSPVAVNSLTDGPDAGEVNIKGRVINHLGESLPSASVAVRNGKSTLTNEKGEFELRKVPVGSILVISYLGYQKKQVEVEGTSPIFVQLNLAENQLDEAHVIAYGQTTQRLSTSNITLVKGKDIDMQPINNPLLALEGRVPGLFITPANGLPGGGVQVRIQGQNSIGNGNEPLYIVDGVPYPMHTLTTTYLGPLGSSNAAFSGVGNPFSFLNPADIESVEVLKDADATAIYGSRAANGAILITTKKGKAGKSKATFNAQQGWGKVPRRLSLMNNFQYLEMQHEALRNDGIDMSSPYYPYFYDVNGVWDTTRYTDWQKTLIGGTSQYTNINGSVAGGNAITQYFIGGTYHRESSIFPGDNHDIKGSVHFNLNTLSSDQKLRVQLSGSYLVDNNKLPSLDLTGSALSLAPDAPALYNSDGSLNWQLDPTGAATWVNPLSQLYRIYNSRTNNLIGNGNISYSILPGLDLKANLGYNTLRTNETIKVSLQAFDPPSQLAYGTKARSASYSYSTIESWIAEPQLTYNLPVKNNKLGFLIGSTIQQSNSNGFSLSGGGFNSDALLDDIHSAATVSLGPSTHSIYKYNALFGRINFNHSDKYILNLSARRDGSSRFGPSSQFHSFYSAGAAWLFSEEELFKGKHSFLSFGKIRGSYGTTGNDQIQEYQYMNLYDTYNTGTPYQQTTGLLPSGIPNPHLQWEETKKIQAGVELGFVENKIFLVVNYTHNQSSNQLLSLALPSIAGFSSVPANLPAKVQNTGIEMSISTINVKTQSFSWNTNFNLTIPRNKLLAYYGTLPLNLVIGQPLNIVKAFRFAGVDPGTGLYQFYDNHGDLTQNPSFLNDRSQVVNVGPRFYGGIQNSLRYKWFQLDFLFQFVKQTGANYIFGQAYPGFPMLNQPTYVLNRWQKPGDVKSIERYNSALVDLTSSYANAIASDAGYSDASFIRLKNVFLSFEVPQKVLRNIHSQGLKIFLQGQNLLTITSFKGLDPETGSLGLPLLRVITAGLQIEF